MISETIASANSSVEPSTYAATIKTQADSKWNVLVSRFNPAADATKVTFKYTVKDNNGYAKGIFGRVRGEFSDATYGNSYMEFYTWAGQDCSALLQEGATYVIEYTLGTATSSIVSATASDGTAIDLTTMAPSNVASMGAYNTARDTSFGIAYISTSADNTYDLELDVQCYDDTGKDLQIAEGGCVEIDGVIAEPDDYKTLTEGSAEDAMFVRSTSGTFNGADGLTNWMDSSLGKAAEYVEDEALKAMGSTDGEALKMDFTPATRGVGEGNFGIFNIKLGRKIKYTSIPETAELVFNARFNSNCDVNIFVLPTSDATRGLANGIMWNKTVNFASDNEFYEMRISYADMAKLVDAEGYISAITFICTGSAGCTSELYIDSIKVAYDSYKATIKTQADGNWNVLVSRLLPSEDATKVTFKYTVIENRSSGVGIWGRVRGEFDNNTFNRSLMKFHTWTTMDNTSMLQVGATYTIEFDLVNRNNSDYVAAVDKNGNDILSSIPGLSNEFGATNEYIDSHFGIGYVTTDGTNLYDLVLDVQCYDNTGKDLQITEGGWANVEGVIGEPEDVDKLTEGTVEDAMYVRSNSGMINGSAGLTIWTDSSLNRSSQYVEDEALKEMGSKDGKALKMLFNPEVRGVTGNDNFGIINVEFGRKVKYADLANTDELMVNARFNSDADVNIFVLPIFDTTRTLSGGVVWNKGLNFPEQDQFYKLSIGYGDMAKFVDSEGYITGFTFICTGYDGGYSELYIDEVVITHAVNINFYDGNEMVDGLSLRTGLTIAEQVAEDLPTGSDTSKKFLGWSASQTEIELIDNNLLITDDLNLYAIYDTDATEVADYTAYAKNYFNVETNKGFALATDKSVADILGQMGFDSYAVYNEISGKIFFVAGNDVIIAEVTEDAIIIGEEVYTVVMEMVKVTYKAEGQADVEINVPSGAKVGQISATKEGYTLTGWVVEGQTENFDFTNAITADTVLVAQFAFNEVESYTNYVGWYYCAENGEFIVVNADKTVKVGQNTINVKINMNGSVYEGANVVMIIGNGNITYNAKTYTKLNAIYTVEFVVDDQVVETITVTAEDGYVLDISELSNPTKKGYTFVEWKVADEKLNDGIVVTEDLTVVATFKKAATLSCVSSAPSSTFIGGLTMLLAAVVAIRRKSKKEN